MSEEQKPEAGNQKPEEAKAVRKTAKTPTKAAPSVASVDPAHLLKCVVKDVGELLTAVRKLGGDEEIQTAVRKLEAAKHALERAAK